MSKSMSRTTMIELMLYVSGIATAGIILWLAPFGGWWDWIIATAIMLGDVALGLFISRRSS